MRKKFYSKIIWLTGLSGSGKTTISKKLYEIFSKKKYKIIKIDGDFVRKITNNTKDFSKIFIRSFYYLAKNFNYRFIS